MQFYHATVGSTCGIIYFIIQRLFINNYLELFDAIWEMRIISQVLTNDNICFLSVDIF